jgi:hypothetical protein
MSANPPLPGLVNLNQWYDAGDMSFIIMSACLVL